MKRSKILLMAIITGVMSLTFMMLGITLAFFNYVKDGTKDNTITTGSITFLYTETSSVGNGISLTNAFPIDDGAGKLLSGEKNVFDFKITSTTPNSSKITYEVTARKEIVENMLDEDVVRIYLTKVSGTSEEEVLLANFDKLPQSNVVNAVSHAEKTIYTGEVAANSKKYEQDFRLRMWVDEDTNFSPIKDNNGNDVYPYNNKKFTVTINVYANAEVVKKEVPISLNTAIFNKYSIVDDEPTLNKTSYEAGDVDGLYSSTNTDSGNATYYFRGNVTNNYVNYAGLTWRIIRINEDGTVRIMATETINPENRNYPYYTFNNKYNGVSYMYYTESDIEGYGKNLVDKWYNDTIVANGYDDKLVSGNYFCEAARVAEKEDYTNAGSANMLAYTDTNYSPTFKCVSDDGNGKGYVNSSVGLITLDEVIYAGGYFNQSNYNFYLSGFNNYHTMTPAGMIHYSETSSSAFVWCLSSTDAVYDSYVNNGGMFYPMVNLKVDTMVTGIGDSETPWTVQ